MATAVKRDRTVGVKKLSEFGRLLRRAGLRVDTLRMIEFVKCAAELPAGELYWAGRVTLVSSPDELPIYDHLFDEFFSGSLGEAERQVQSTEIRLRLGAGDEADGEDSTSGAAGDSQASSVELVNERQLDACTPEELADLDRLGATLRLRPPARRSRRRVSSRRGSLNLGDTMRKAARTGGDPLLLSLRSPTSRPLRVVLAIDVSGSMKSYSRSSLLFAHTGIRVGLPWRTFCFGTRTTEVTDCLAAPSPDQALAAVASRVRDLDGGTRIGEGLRRLIDQAGPSPVRGALVVIFSDGLETGRADELGRQMKRIHSVARAVCWLNPLKSTPGYEPIAAGMRAALPWISYFGDGHNLTALHALLPRLTAVASSPRRGNLMRGAYSVAEP